MQLTFSTTSNCNANEQGNQFAPRLKNQTERYRTGKKNFHHHIRGSSVKIALHSTPVHRSVGETFLNPGERGSSWIHHADWDGNVKFVILIDRTIRAGHQRAKGAKGTSMPFRNEITAIFPTISTFYERFKTPPSIIVFFLLLLSTLTPKAILKSGWYWLWPRPRPRPQGQRSTAIFAKLRTLENEKKGL